MINRIYPASHRPHIQRFERQVMQTGSRVKFVQTSLFRTTLARKFHRVPNQLPSQRMSYTPLAGAPAGVEVAQVSKPEGRYHKVRSQSYKMASELSPEPSSSASVTDQIDRHLQVLTRKKQEWAQLPLHRKIEFLLVSSPSANCSNPLASALGDHVF